MNENGMSDRALLLETYGAVKEMRGQLGPMMEKVDGLEAELVSFKRETRAEQAKNRGYVNRLMGALGVIFFLLSLFKEKVLAAFGGG